MKSNDSEVEVIAAGHFGPAQFGIAKPEIMRAEYT